MFHDGLYILYPKQAHRALIGAWSQDHHSLHTKKKDIKINIVQCYAPTNDSEEEDKDQFYSRLQEILGIFPKKDITILMGDLNAKIGSDNTGYEHIMGIHAPGIMNENGERFADLCALNSMVIGGSIFQHKTIHKKNLDLSR